MRVFRDTVLGKTYYHMECVILGVCLWKWIWKWTMNMRSFLTGENNPKLICRQFHLMWWLFFNGTSSSKKKSPGLLATVFSRVFCPGVLFTILTSYALIVKHHIASCMLWYKALKSDHLQVHIGIWGCRQFKMRGPDFAGKQRVFL